MFTTAMIGALVPGALAQLEKKPAGELAGLLSEATVPYLQNPKHRKQLAAVLVETALQLYPGIAAERFDLGGDA